MTSAVAERPTESKPAPPPAEVLTKRPLAELVEDFSIYPRHAVDGQHVQALANALRTGVKLPPIVIDKKSFRIVDGWHRFRAHRAVSGAQAVVDVLEVDYPDENAIFADSVIRNSAHGRKLDVMDKTRIAVLGRERGIPLQIMATWMHMPTDHVEKLVIRVATTTRDGPGNVPGTLQIALKSPVTHLAGKEITPEQATAHQTVPGTSYRLLARQLIDAVKFQFFDMDDPRLVADLWQLHKALGELLKKHPEQ